MKTKFLIEKNYNISVLAEGLDINEASLEFSLLLDDYKISIPLKNIKENVFRLRLPAKVKNSITNAKNIDYTITAVKDNLIFEVAKSTFELEYFAVKQVKIEESTDEDVEAVVITPTEDHSGITITEETTEIQETTEEANEGLEEIEEESAPIIDNVNINDIDSKFKTLAYLLGRK